MNVRALLEELERLGVEVRAVNDDLEYEGPEVAITPQLLERLKAHKAELIAVCGKNATLAEEDRTPSEAASIRTAAGPEACKLLAAGWDPKERCEKIIWKRPVTGFYYSQEMATYCLDRGNGTVGYKSGANGRR